MAGAKAIALRRTSIVEAHQLSVGAVFTVYGDATPSVIAAALGPVYTDTARLLRDAKSDCLRMIQRNQRLAGASSSDNEAFGADDLGELLAAEMARFTADLDAVVAFKAAMRFMGPDTESDSTLDGQAAFNERLTAALREARELGVISQTAFDHAQAQVVLTSH